MQKLYENAMQEIALLERAKSSENRRLSDGCHFLLIFSINRQIIAQAWQQLGRRFSCCGLNRHMLRKSQPKGPETCCVIARSSDLHTSDPHRTI